MNSEQSIKSISGLLALTDLDLEGLIFKIGAPMDGEGDVAIAWDDSHVGVEISKGTQGMIAELAFPFTLTEFWGTVHEHVGEVDAFEL